jgi:hypothetical protein
MALSPLCRQERSPRDALTHAAEVITSQTSDTIQRADLPATLAIFGKMMHPNMNVLDLIGREQMKESRIIEEFQEEARVEKARQFILAYLRVRFGPAVAAEFAPTLNTITDSDKLDQLYELALASSGPKQFGDRFRNL